MTLTWQMRKTSHAPPPPPIRPPHHEKVPSVINFEMVPTIMWHVEAGSNYRMRLTATIFLSAMQIYLSENSDIKF